MQVKAFINGSLYKTYSVVADSKGNWDARPINFSILEDKKLGLLVAFEPITEIKLEPQH